MATPNTTDSTHR